MTVQSSKKFQRPSSSVEQEDKSRGAPAGMLGARMLRQAHCCFLGHEQAAGQKQEVWETV